MKNLVTILVFSILLSLNLFSQEEKTLEECKNNLTFSPFKFIFSELQLNYERIITPKLGVKLLSNYHYSDNSNRLLEGYKGELQIKYLVSTYQDDVAIIRMYFSPYLYFGKMDITPDQPEYNYITYEYNDLYKTQTVSGGILYGFSFTFNNKFHMDIYAGGGLKRASDDGAPDSYSKNIFQPAYSGIYPRGGFDIGFVF